MDHATLLTGTVRPQANSFVEDAELPLQRIYRAEQQRAQQSLFTQPWQADLQHWTWSQAMADVRRVAHYLQEQNFPPGSHIAIMA